MFQCIRTWFSIAQSSFITKFLLNFCDKICRAHTVLARSKMQEKQNFLKRKVSVSLEKDFIIYIYIYIYICIYIFIIYVYIFIYVCIYILYICIYIYVIYIYYLHIYNLKSEQENRANNVMRLRHSSHWYQIIIHDSLLLETWSKKVHIQ